MKTIVRSSARSFVIQIQIQAVCKMLSLSTILIFEMITLERVLILQYSMDWKYVLNFHKLYSKQI